MSWGGGKRGIKLAVKAAVSIVGWQARFGPHTKVPESVPDSRPLGMDREDTLDMDMHVAAHALIDPCDKSAGLCLCPSVWFPGMHHFFPSRTIRFRYEAECHGQGCERELNLDHQGERCSRRMSG